MKPIIVDMKDMSDSTEIYESKPNRFLVYTIYLILIIVVVAVLWMSLFKMDIVVKSNGLFKGSNAVYEISSGVTGSVKKTYIENGQYVTEGDVLYVLSIDELSDTILRYQNELEAAKARLEILSVYEKSLDGDKTELEALSNNEYYDEFINRRELLYANVNLSESDTAGQVTLYQGNVDSISGTIAKYNEKIEKLNNVKQCIMTRNNTFDSSEGIYYSMVSSYLASYNYTSVQYDNQINDYQRQIDEYEDQIKKAEASKEDEPATWNETVSGNDIVNENEANVTQPVGSAVDVEELQKQRDTLITARDSVQKEKTQALMNLELQQITTIEQQISGYNDTILSLETNLTSAKLQLDAVNGVDNKAKETVAILTEKGNIEAEILTYEDKVKECETYLKSYDIQNDNCIVKANVSGYFYVSQELKTGSFVQEGTTIGTIYPETESKYYAEIYIENTDIAKVKEGQEVKFEIAAYPSSEYGYFEGVVDNIAKDISVDQSTGYAYYMVRVKCENMTLKGKDGEEATLMNGMACQSKIVVDEKNVLTYLLEKIDLWD
ncbi:HlyD family efflux transporter periplasmic adaptor subunit [Petralouisia muris]|uniref:HlyD family efflux transporter periplasmic adaptor subunit n=1 Tax=Petralouisia muris TaxID=3032872 RepID=A0AC61RNP5_9FIRM|nr:HlyD family efflux transporter periplasmic adaptor subunit [Petralouisia muris]TGY88734.1 HlyD family efflux transporter periplasmic adaptor subunit [Petralouisia muris]